MPCIITHIFYWDVCQLKIAIAAIVKDEADYLLEWMAYHWVVGIRHFCIASNDSTDATNTILIALAKMGLVTFIEFPTYGDQKPQLPAYQELLRRCPKEIDLLAYIDADEFITPMTGEDSILPFFKKVFSDESVSALAMQWACFGSGGQLFKEPGLVIERFTQQSAQGFSVNKHYKTIARRDRIKGFKNPHHIILKEGRYINALLQDLTFGKVKGISEEVMWDNIRLNHYVVKSLEEFLLIKSKKGNASYKKRVVHKEYFLHHDKNDEPWRYSADLLIKVRHAELVLQKIVNGLACLKTGQPWYKRSKLTKKQQKEKLLIKLSGFFDPVWYWLTYPDVAVAGFDALEHYVRFGFAENRQPSEGFDAVGYCEQYKDVAVSKMNPLVHYLRFGKAEGRKVIF